MRLFISYARQDQPKVRPLTHGLRLLGHDVWLDEEDLRGGQEWWDTILGQIRDCDAMLVAVSPATLRSQACEREREYAAALGKPLLPVIVEQVLPDLFPPELAVIQAVDYTSSGQEAVFRFAGALSMLPPAPPLPTPMPAPPSVPISYLSDLSHRIHAPTLGLDEQSALVARLKTAFERADERDAASYLLRELQQRADLYQATAKELQQLQARLDTVRPDEGQSASPATDVSPARRNQEWRAELISDSGSARTFAVTLSEERHVLTIKSTLGNSYFVVLVDNKRTERAGSDQYYKEGLAFVLNDGNEKRTAKFSRIGPWAGQFLNAALGGASIGVYRRVGPVRLSVEDQVLYEG